MKKKYDAETGLVTFESDITWKPTQKYSEHFYIDEMTFDDNDFIPFIIFSINGKLVTFEKMKMYLPELSNGLTKEQLLDINYMVNVRNYITENEQTLLEIYFL